jgi:hypothetical protein
MSSSPGAACLILGRLDSIRDCGTAGREILTPGTSLEWQGILKSPSSLHPWADASRETGARLPTAHYRQRQCLPSSHTAMPPASPRTDGEERLMKNNSSKRRAQPAAPPLVSEQLAHASSCQCGRELKKSSGSVGCRRFRLDRRSLLYEWHAIGLSLQREGVHAH